MRKVFLSNIILNEVRPTKYISDDFKLPKKEFNFLMSYFVDMNVKEGDEVAVVTCYTPGATALLNYENFKKEVCEILKQKNAKGEFIDIEQKVDFDSLTFNAFFKKIVKELKEDDVLYVDMTFGMKPYSISLFTAAAYAVKVGENIRVESIVYAQKYTGQKSVKEVDTSKIYDITTLFFLNEIAGNLRKGEKTSADKMLDVLIADCE